MSKLVEDIKLIIENEDIEDLCSYSYISYDIDVDDINKNENIEESFKDYILENDCCLSNKADKSNTTKEKLNKFELEEINYWVDDLYKLLGFNLENFDIERSNRADKLINKLEENGTIYYMNGKNGTEFDW